MSSNRFIMLIFTFCCNVSLFGSDDLMVFDDHDDVTIKSHLFYYVDLNHSMSFNQAYEKYHEGKFSRNNDIVFAREASASSYWFAFNVKSKIDQQVWMNLNNCNLDSIHFYKFDGNGVLVDQYLTGCFLGRDSRVYDAKTFWFPIIEANDEATYTYLLKVYSGGMMEVPIYVGTFSGLSNDRINREFYSIFFIGALILIFVYTLFNFLYTKDRIYFYYSAYIFFITLNVTLYNNFPIVEYIFGLYFTHRYALIWMTPGFIFIGLFSVKYLNLKENLNWAYRLILVEVVLLSLFSLLNIGLPLVYLASLSQIVVVLFVFTCLWSGYYCWFKAKTDAGLYSIGWTVLITSSLLYLLTVNGIVPYYFYLRNSMYLGIMIEVTIFSIALAKRINTLKEEQNKLTHRLKLKNEELIFINESLDAFNYHVSHDLKTVLSNANSMARMAKKYHLLKNPSKLEEVIKRLLVITTKGLDTIQVFLSFGSSKYAIVDSETDELDIEREISNILNLNDLESKVEVVLMTNNIKTIRLNQKVFESIFLNLLTNTIQFNDNRPVAHIEFSESNDGITVQYSDNSLGVDLEKNGVKLFQPFETLDKKHGQEIESTGLGLYLVKRIIHSHNGVMEVESELGEGIRYSINLPQ